jgi:hypothetical protein
MIRSQRESYPRIVVKASWDVGELLRPRHDRACPGHPDPVKRRVSRVGITGARPVMTEEGVIPGPSAAGDDRGISRTDGDTE